MKTKIYLLVCLPAVLVSLVLSSCSIGSYAAISLNDYYSADEITEMSEQYSLTVTSIYMWKPGETGRTMLLITNNDISGSIAKLGTPDESADPEEYCQIFGIVVKSSTAKIDAMKTDGLINELQYTGEDDGGQTLFIKPDGAE